MKSKSSLLLCLLAAVCLGSVNAEPAKETKYLAFQIFTYGPNPLVATMGEGPHPQPARFPEKAVLRDYIGDIKGRIGSVGDPQTRLAVMLGQLSFDHEDADVTKFIQMGFELAIETDVAVGFHIDDSMFWARRKDLWSDPKNVEAMDWDGTPCTSRRLDWGKNPSVAPPQMCFNSKAIQQEVTKRATLIGQAIQAGVKRLEGLNRPELFAGVIAGSETMIGQDFKTGQYLGYRALLNRGFSREHPPQDPDLEREKVVQEFIELWTGGLAQAGVSTQKIYSHTAFLSRRAYGLGASKEITYMQHDKETAYSKHNHFAPPSVAFGSHHRPGFSTYPQPGLFEDIYELMAQHQQAAWASCEGTNMQPASGPGQTGMNMETYLGQMFNHGAALVTLFSWGIGGDANKNMGYRVVTEGEEALQAYRKFLKGGTLVESKSTTVSLFERLPPKIHKIEKELPAWIEKVGDKEKASAAAALMSKMQAALKAKQLEETEAAADAILKMMGGGAASASQAETKAAELPLMERLPAKIHKIQADLPVWVQKGGDREKAAGLMQKLGAYMKAKDLESADKTADAILEMIGARASASAPPPPASGPSSESPAKRLPEKIARIKEGVQKWAASGHDPSEILRTMTEKFKPLMDAGKTAEAEAELDRVLEALSQDGKTAEPATAPRDAVRQRVVAKIEQVKEGAHQWERDGRSTAAISKMMAERVKPLLDGGKFAEGEAELDRVLKLLADDDASPAQDHPKEERKELAPEAAAALEQVATGFRLAESPVWDGESLLFCDVFPSKIHKLGADGKVSTIRSDTRKAAGLAFDSKGRLLICEVDGFRVIRIEKDGTETTLADAYLGKKLNGPNDLVVDRKDGIYFTDPLFLNKDKREQDKDAVYYISPEGKVLRVADDLEKPNGIALSLDGKTLYVADTAQSELRAYSVKADGTLGEGHDFGSVPGPDGVRVDADGKVYAAGKTGIAVWDASGKRLGTLKVPAPLTSLAFGDADRRTMFITTNPSVFKIRLDQALKLLTADEASIAQAPSPPAPAEAAPQGIAAKVERIKDSVQKLAQSGRDPSTILTTMREKVGPLLKAGKVNEAEPELDRVLELLEQDAK